MSFTREDLQNATVTITRDGKTRTFAFDEFGIRVPRDEPDVLDPEDTVWMPTNGRVPDGRIPIRKHRNAWTRIGVELHNSGNSKLAQQLAGRLEADPGEWVTIDVPEAIALQIARRESRE